MAYYHPKDPNQIIAWRELPDTLKLNDEDPPLRPLPDLLVHLLNHNLSHEHLRLVFAKICAQLPAAASMAHKELMAPVSFYDNLKAAAFLGIDYNVTSENLPTNIVTSVVHAYNVGASEHIIQTMRNCELPGPERKIPVPQNQGPTREQLQHLKTLTPQPPKQAPTIQQGAPPHPGTSQPQVQAPPNLQAPQRLQNVPQSPQPGPLPPQTQALAPQIALALQAKQYGLQFQNADFDYRRGLAPLKPATSIPQGHASAYEAGLAAAMAAPPSSPTGPQAGPSAAQASPPGPKAKVKGPAKRKADEANNSGFPICTTCNKSFNFDKNGPASCTYHTGKPVTSYLPFPFARLTIDRGSGLRP